MTQNLKIEVLTGDISIDGTVVSNLVTKEELSTAIVKKADLGTDGKIPTSQLPAEIVNTVGIVDEVKLQLETSIKDAVDESNAYAESYTDNALTSKADLTSGKVPLEQLPAIDQYPQFDTALSNLSTSILSATKQRTDQLEKSKADLGEDGKVLREQIPSYEKISGLPEQLEVMSTQTAAVSGELVAHKIQTADQIDTLKENIEANVQQLTDRQSHLLRTYATKELGVDAKVGVKPGEYFYVRSANEYELLVEYQNVSGNAVATGKRYPSSNALNNIPHNNLKDRDAVGVHPASSITTKSPPTTSVLRSLQDKLDDAVSVKDFGAKGDGVTDDTIAINNAVSSGASVVFCPEGTYMLSNSIYLPENISFYCTGNAELRPILPISTFFSAIRVNNGCVVTVNADGIDFPVYNAAKFTAVSGLIGTEMHNVTIKDCNFKNVQNGVRLDGANNCTITNNRFKTTGTSGVLIGVNDGINAIRNTITHNHFDDMGDTAVAFFSNHSNAVTAYNIIAHNHAIDTQRITGGFAYDFEGGKGELKAYNIIAHNTVEYTKKSGFDQNGIVMANSINGIIIGNTVKGNDAGQSQGVSIFGCENVAVTSNILSDLSVGIAAGGVSGCVLSNNIMRDCGRDSQSFPSIAFSGSGVKVLGNAISFSPESLKVATCGIRATTAVMGGSDIVGVGWEITGNTITGYKGFGIHLSGTDLTYLDKVIVSDNNIQGTGTEMYDAIYVARAKNLTIKGNTLQDMSRGVALNHINKLVFVGNLIEDTKDTPTMSWILSLSISESVVLDRYLLKDNIFGATASNNPIIPTSMLTNSGLTMIGNTRFLDKNEGKATSITSGALIPHGLYAPPNKIQITLAENVDVSNVYATVSGSRNIVINFTGGVPASFYWSASV